MHGPEVIACVGHLAPQLQKILENDFLVILNNFQKKFFLTKSQRGGGPLGEEKFLAGKFFSQKLLRTTKK